MADTLTTSLQFIQQTNDENEGTWGDNVDTNWERAEQAIAGVTTKAVTGASDVTLTSAEQRSATLIFTGTLTADQTIIVGSYVKKWDVYNNTDGPYALTVKTSAGTGITVPQGSYAHLYCDATNVVEVDVRAFIGAPELWDDFLGDALDARWSGVAGSDPQAVAPAIAAALNGVVRLVSGDAGGGDDAVDVSVLTHGLNWQADQGGLFMETKVKVDDITTVALFAGFTDVAGTAELPIEGGASDTAAANATDACGIIFDTANDTDEWGAVGVKAGTETAQTFAGSAPVNGTFATLRVVVSATGTLTAYLNNDLIATIANAVTATVPLTPVLAVMSRTTATRTLDGDYVLARQSR